MDGRVRVIAVVVTPGATAYLLSDKFKHILFISIAIGGLSSLIGTYLSYFIDGATGAVIVCIQTLCFAIAFLFAPKQGLFISKKQRSQGSKGQHV